MRREIVSVTKKVVKWSAVGGLLGAAYGVAVMRKGRKNA